MFHTANVEKIMRHDSELVKKCHMEDNGIKQEEGKKMTNMALS